MQTISLTLDLPDDMERRFFALPPDARNRFVSVAVYDLLNASDQTFQTNITDEGDEINETLVAELIAADEETKRVGLTPFEEIVRRADADDGPGFVERARARLTAKGINPAQIIGAGDGAAA